MDKLTRCFQTGKVIFASKGEAITVMKKPNVRGSRGKKRKKRETRAYECEFCDGWHLTSIEHYKR